MTHWIEIGSELNNNFSFNLSNDLNNELKIKFVKSYFESSYKLLKFAIFMSLFMNITLFVSYLIFPGRILLFDLLTTIFIWNFIVFIWLVAKITNLGHLHVDIFNNKNMFFSVVKESSPEGVSHILHYKIINQPTIINAIGDEQFNPLNNV